MRDNPNRCGYCAIVGRPNVGKSTLLNCLIGQKLAITSHKPQTTRHNILGVKTRSDGQIIYVDTPGLHQRGNQMLNRYLNRTAKSVVADVDLLMLVVEANRWTDEDAGVLNLVIQSKLPTVLVINKIDRIKRMHTLLPYIEKISVKHKFNEIIPLSARKFDNIQTLENVVLKLLPKGGKIFPDDQLSDRSERFFASEIIREQLVRRYAREIPYALTVEIDKFEQEDKLYRISSQVWVERIGQKKIIIGNKGAALKEVATKARKELEKFFQKKVYLRIWIKVKKSWSSNDKSLTSLGYGD